MSLTLPWRSQPAQSQPTQSYEQCKESIVSFFDFMRQNDIKDINITHLETYNKYNPTKEEYDLNDKEFEIRQNFYKTSQPFKTMMVTWL